MLRLLQTMCLPRDIIILGIEVAKNCQHCRKFHPRMPRPRIKSHLSTTFNEVVQHDLFFLWDQTFMLLVDEALRWKTGNLLENKEGPTLVKALVLLWIRLWRQLQVSGEEPPLGARKGRGNRSGAHEKKVYPG